MASRQRARRHGGTGIRRFLGRGLRYVIAVLWRSGRWGLRRVLPLAAASARGLAAALRGYLRWAWARPRRLVDSAVLAAVVIVLVLALAGPPITLYLGNSVDCLALNIYHEARGESPEGQLAVAQVVMNRVAHPRFPDSVCAVVKQGGEWPRDSCQFSWWCDGQSDAARDEAALARLRSLARGVMRGGKSDPSGGALWYHADSVSPTWRTAFEEGPTIGRHIFYRPKDGWQ